MNRANPKYVLRNYLAQVAIDKAAEYAGESVDVILQAIDCPPFHQTWHRVLATWARKTPDTSYTGSRITAYMASVTKDPELGRKAWSQLRASLQVKGKDRFPAVLTTINGPEVPVPATEGPQIDTPGTAQWALSLITGMELARDFYEAP